VLIDLGIEIDTAKIMTIGERAEDVFYIVDGNGEPLSGELRETLRQRLVATLDTRD